MFEVRVDKQASTSLRIPIAASQDASQPAFKARPNEPAYALLPPSNGAQSTSGASSIELVERSDCLAGREPEDQRRAPRSAPTPTATSSTGFTSPPTTASAATPARRRAARRTICRAHISFRSVGYVEGGTYPDFRRVNISMACNHCDDPVCLKGCPTRAYTKFAEYGAVLQDPDICFGCGYCTWVAPTTRRSSIPRRGRSKSATCAWIASKSA